MERHHSYVNADRLARVIKVHQSGRVRAFWSAIGTWLDKDRRLARLASLYDGPAVDVLSVGTDFQIDRRGVDPRFEETPLRVPAGILKTRRADVLSAELLASHHRGYRNRVLMGPSWRADVWTVLETSSDLSIAEVARRAYSSFSTAWEVTQDYKLLRRADEGSTGV